VVPEPLTGGAVGGADLYALTGLVAARVTSAVAVKSRRMERGPGADVMISKIFSPKNLAKKLAFLTQNKAKF
jgi:hypothetical protein